MYHAIANLRQILMRIVKRTFAYVKPLPGIMSHAIAQVVPHRMAVS